MGREVANNIDDAVRFRPSRVEGADGVEEVCVSRDALEVIAAGRRRVFPFLSFALGREIASGRVPVGELHFSKSRYADSHVVFYTTPRITVFMPVDGPATSPHSHFFRIQAVLREGGFKLYDEHFGDGPPKTPPLVLHPRPLRTVVYLLLILSFAWVFTLAGLLPEPAGGAWRNVLFHNPHNPAIGLSFMLPKMAIPALLAFRHGRSMRLLATIIAASYGIAFVSGWALFRAVRSWAEFETLAFDVTFWSARHLVSGFLIVTVCALIGWSWRNAFLEPIRPSRTGSNPTAA